MRILRKIIRTIVCLIFLCLALLLAINVYAAELKLTWTDTANNEEGFRIYRRESQASTFAKIHTTGPNIELVTDITVTEGIEYCYHVTAFNDAGESAPSNAACGTALKEEPPPPPTNFTFKIEATCSGVEKSPGVWEITCPAP